MATALRQSFTAHILLSAAKFLAWRQDIATRDKLEPLESLSGSSEQLVHGKKNPVLASQRKANGVKSSGLENIQELYRVRSIPYCSNGDQQKKDATVDLP